MRSGARNMTPDTLISSTFTVDHSGRFISVPSTGGTRGHCRRSISPGSVCSRTGAVRSTSSIGRVPSAHASPIRYRVAPDPLPSSWACRTSALTSRWLPCSEQPRRQPAARRQAALPIRRAPHPGSGFERDGGAMSRAFLAACRPARSGSLFVDLRESVLSRRPACCTPAMRALQSAPTRVQRSRQLGRLVSPRQIPPNYSEVVVPSDLVRLY